MFRLIIFRAVSCIVLCLLTLPAINGTASNRTLPLEAGSSDSGTYIDPTG